MRWEGDPPDLPICMGQVITRLYDINDQPRNQVCKTFFGHRDPSAGPDPRSLGATERTAEVSSEVHRFVRETEGRVSESERVVRKSHLEVSDEIRWDDPRESLLSRELFVHGPFGPTGSFTCLRSQRSSVFTTSTGVSLSLDCVTTKHGGFG